MQGIHAWSWGGDIPLIRAQRKSSSATQRQGQEEVYFKRRKKLLLRLDFGFMLPQIKRVSSHTDEERLPMHACLGEGRRESEGDMGGELLIEFEAE